MAYKMSISKILIVEDDIPTNRLFQFFLKSNFDGEIISAHDGYEAVEKCIEHQPELIFMDINMPYKDGITAIQEIRTSGYTNPIVVISSYSDSTKKKCYDAGADAVITKPIAREDFLGLVKKFNGNA
ncbi:MAG: response regulator [Candidatus Marinimicrobia bacterium]|nr:response regulator [Candidatus Neomarinimicrobiota bacterium]